MKKSVFQLIIITILLLGMAGIIIVVKTSIDDRDYSDYYPIENPNNEQEQEDGLSLDGYVEVNVIEQEFYKFSNLRFTYTYYDEEESFEEISLDEIGVKIGTRVNVGDVIGKAGGIDFESTVNGIVVSKDTDKITIKVLTELYANFTYNIYEINTYFLGDKFDVFKNGSKVTIAEIVYIDYLHVVDDCVKATLKIDNDNLYFINDGYIEFSPIGYEIEKSLAISRSALNISSDSYQVLDKVHEFVYVKNNMAYKIDIQFGICYYDYVQILSIKCNYDDFELEGGTLYAKSSN